MLAPEFGQEAMSPHLCLPMQAEDSLVFFELAKGIFLRY